MALSVESFEIEAQIPDTVGQGPSALKKATPILLGASCLAALALFHTSPTPTSTSQDAQQLAAIGSPHVNEGSVRINGLPPSDINGVISSVQDVAQRMPEVASGDAARRFGGSRDEHGCMGSAGFVWCASAGECVQPWAEPCASLQQQLQNSLPERPQEPFDWALLGHGGCRTASGDAGIYSVLPGRAGSVSGADACRFACTDAVSCLAYEIRESDGRCELHTATIDHVNPAAGYACWIKTPSEHAHFWLGEAPSQHASFWPGLTLQRPDASIIGSHDEGDDAVAAPTHQAMGNVPSVQALPDDLILQRPGANSLGGTRDEHECLGSSGFTWCPSLARCVRGYSQSCPGGTETCQRLCAREPLADDGLRFSCTCREGVALDHMPPAVQQ